MTSTADAQLLHLAAALLAGIAAGCVSYLLLLTHAGKGMRNASSSSANTDLHWRLMQAGRSLRESRSRRSQRPLAAALERAGISMAPTLFAWLCGLAGIGAMASVTWFAGSVWLGAAGAFATALILPWALLRHRSRRRRERFRAGFTDYLETLARGIRSGYGLKEALGLAASASDGPVRQLAGRLSSEVGAGVRLETALERLTASMPIQEVRVFSCTLLVQHRTGASMTEVVEMLARTMRQEARLRAKVATLSAGARLSAGVMALLPVIAAGSVSVFAPDYLTPLLSHPMGQATLALTLAWMAAGWLLMRALSRPRSLL